MINKISFSNFKSWANFPSTNFSKLTAFFGTNSSGKTSILDFLLLLKQTLESSDRSQVLETGGENSYTQLGSFNDLTHDHNTKDGFNFEISLSFLKDIEVKDTKKRKEILFKDNKLKFGASIQEASTGKGKLYVQEFYYIIGNNKFIIRKTEKDRYDYLLNSQTLKKDKRYAIKRSPGRVWHLPSPIKFHGFPDQVRTYYQNVGFLFDLQLFFESFFKDIYYLGPLREYPQRQYTWTGSQPTDMGKKGELCIAALLSSRLRQIKVSRGKNRKKFSVEEYVAYWLRELSLIDSFSIEEIKPGTNIYQVKVKKNKNSPEVLITDVGFGVSQILPVLTLCYYAPEGSTLLIEQPEIHLHPRVQSGLADVFIDAIKNRNLQIILESHSEHLLRRLQLRIAQNEYTNTETKIFFCETDGKESNLVRLNLDLFGRISNWPKDFFGDEIKELAEMNNAIRKRSK